MHGSPPNIVHESESTVAIFLFFLIRQTLMDPNKLSVLSYVVVTPMTLSSSNATASHCELLYVYLHSIQLGA